MNAQKTSRSPDQLARAAQRRLLQTVGGSFVRRAVSGDIEYVPPKSPSKDDRRRAEVALRCGARRRAQLAVCAARLEADIAHRAHRRAIAEARRTRIKLERRIGIGSWSPA